MKEKLIKGLRYLKTNAITTTIVIITLTGGTVLAANLANGDANEVVSNTESATQAETILVAQESTTQIETTQAETIAQETTVIPTQEQKVVIQEVVTVAPTEATIQNAPNAKYFTYTMVGGGKDIYITGYSGNESNVVVPSTIDGYNVTGIADDTSGVFNGNLNITSITFPEGLTYLGACTCRACYNLTSVTLPSTLTTIKHGAFFACKSLTSIRLPSSITSIDNDISIFSRNFKVDDKGNQTWERPSLIVVKGSYAMQYAIDNKLQYTTE